MTTNNEQQVQPGNDQQQPNPADAAQAVQQSTEPAVVDIDAQDLADAQAAVEAEKAAAAGDGTSQAQPGAQGQNPNPPQQDQQQQPDAQARGERRSIPPERMDEVLAQRDQERTNAAYWRGVAEARVQPQAQPQGAAQQQTQQQQPTADQRLAAIHSKQDELAAKFDNGEITYTDLVKQQRELGNQEQGIREEVLLARTQPTQQSQQSPQSDALYLDTLTAQLENEHPWVAVFDQVGTETDWSYLKSRAIENCLQQGIDVSNGSIGRYNLRKEVATLADELGPNLVAERARAKGIAIPGQPPAQQQQQQQRGNQQQPLSAAAQSRAAKLDLAERSPPNVQQMSGAASDGTPTDSRIDQMNEDDIGNLPDSTRRRLLGIMN